MSELQLGEESPEVIEPEELAPAEIDGEIKEDEPVDPDVERALNDGWMAKEDWVAKGKDADDWVSHRNFNTRGELMGKISNLSGQIKAQDRKFDDRLASVNKIHKMQIEDSRRMHEEKRDTAIENGDKEAVLKATTSINDLNTQAAELDKKPDVAADQAFVDDFNSNNPWILEAGPKSDYARLQFSRHTGSGMGAADAVEKMMTDVDKHFPKVNKSREQPNRVEANRGRAGATASKRSLVMADATNEEMSMRMMFGSDKEFLKAIQDARV